VIWLIIGIVFVLVVAAAALASNLKDVYDTVRAVLRRPAVGKEAMRGKTAVVKSALRPEGRVMLDGELWTAVSREGNIEAGTTVRVDGLRGLKLFVRRQDKP